MNMMLQSASPVMTERRVTLLGALLVAVGPISMALYTPAMPEIVRAFGTTEAGKIERKGQLDSGFRRAEGADDFGHRRGVERH